MYKRFVKRFLDFILSLIAFFLLMPVLCTIALIIRIKLGSPVLFKQKRPGKNEKIFTIYKFRSMSDIRDKNGNLLSDKERLGKTGKWIRSLSLDELPSLLNIIKGDMSLVGPRPLLIEYLPLYDDVQKQRHNVRPGLTGLAQVNGRNSITWEDKFRYDLEYINNITFISDLKIILLTVKKVFEKEGINSETCVTMEVFQGTKKD